MKNSKKKVLVLGGTGAMGVYLIPELLSSGYEVSVTSRKELPSNEKMLNYITGNAKDNDFLNSLLENKYDVIIDFMVYHTDEFKRRYKTLLGNTKQYIFLSSYRVYANNNLDPICEETPFLLDTVDDEAYLATDEYALTKARQEKILQESEESNWTIVRPAITYSKERFQLGTMEAHEFLYRALNNKPIIFPKEMLEKETTMSWAGDVAKLISRLTLNEKAFSESYNVSTSEHHKWSEVIGYYADFLDIKVKLVSLEKYEQVFGRPYQIKYDRMYNRIVNNTKVLNATGLEKNDFLSLRDGLRMELSVFSHKPTFQKINLAREKTIDELTASRLHKIRRKIKPRTRIRQVKAYIKSKQYDGAIVTLAGYYNYGSIIQRYALQQFLRNNGKKFILFDLKFMRKMSKNAVRCENLELFAKKYFDEEVFDLRYSSFYSTYIVGSDQTWRDFFKDWSKFGIFFLNFVHSNKAKRIAYASSFGLDTLAGAGINDQNKQRIIPLIKKFNAISVREKSGIDLVKGLGGTAKHALDPTLLLSASSYSDLINASSCCEENTSPIFYYILDQSIEKRDVIKQFEKHLNVKAEGIAPTDGNSLPPVEKWLKGFRDSQFVLTDSFHGIVFSIINHKPFLAFGNSKRGLTRMTELLELLGIENRIIMESSPKLIIDDLKSINWAAVDSTLDNLRNESASWLINNLENGQQQM